MIYTKTVTAGSGGSAAAPSSVDLPVTHGLVYQFELYFPPGSSGLLYVKVTDGAFSVWPSEPNEWFYGDNTLISFPDRYYVSSADHRFKVWYYNLDDTYDHKFTVRIGQVLADAFIRSFVPGFKEKNISEVLAELAEQQAAERGRRIKEIGDYFALEEEATVEEGAD